jgi:two-component system, NarL family, sensor kinase
MRCWTGTTIVVFCSILGSPFHFYWIPLTTTIDKEQLVWASLGTAAIFTVLAGIVIYYLVSMVKNHRRHEAEKVALRLQFDKEVRGAELEISELTMKRIAQEIHDNVGQTLTLANLHFDAIEKGELERIPESKKLIQRALDDLRGISRSLSPNYQLELGLEKGVRRELDLISLSTKIETHIEVKQTTASEEPSSQEENKREIIFFRCVQEALSNSIKHANPTKIIVCIEFLNDSCKRIEITDNGKGIHPSHFQKGIGLQSMKERMQLINGACLLESVPHQGTKITLTTEHHG